LQNIDAAEQRFFYQAELLIKALKMGYLFAEVPYAIKIRADGKSKALH